jgi:hypothetical protein
MTENNTKNCAQSGFNYCFWAKLIVGVPAIFIIAYTVGSQFENPFVQMWASAIAGVGSVWVAMKIDKHPALQKKIVQK